MARQATDFALCLDRGGCDLPSLRGIAFNGVGFMLKAARNVFRNRWADSASLYWSFSVLVMEVAIPFEKQSRGSIPFIDPDSPLVPAAERAAILMLPVTLNRMGVWIDEFSSAIELLDYCQNQAMKVRQKNKALFEQEHIKGTLPKLFGSEQEKLAAHKNIDRIRVRMEKLDIRASGYRDWSVIAAKGAALALHDFGRAHEQIISTLSKNAKSVGDLIDAKLKKDATKFFHDEFGTVFIAIRNGIAHMQEKFGMDADGIEKHKPKGDQVMFGLAMIGRKFSTTWGGKVHSIMLDASTVQKMERLYGLWSIALRQAASAVSRQRIKR